MDDEEVSAGPDKIDCANSVLKFVNRATDRYTKLENALDELIDLMNDTWEGTEDELDAAILKHNVGFQKFEKDCEHD